MKESPEETFTQRQVEKIIGDKIEAEQKTIPVCAGQWRRLDAETWTFDQDPDWDE